MTVDTSGLEQSVENACAEIDRLRAEVARLTQERDQSNSRQITAIVDAVFKEFAIEDADENARESLAVAIRDSRIANSDDGTGADVLTQPGAEEKV